MSLKSILLWMLGIFLLGTLMYSIITYLKLVASV